MGTITPQAARAIADAAAHTPVDEDELLDADAVERASRRVRPHGPRSRQRAHRRGGPREATASPAGPPGSEHQTGIRRHVQAVRHLRPPRRRPHRDRHRGDGQTDPPRRGLPRTAPRPPSGTPMRSRRSHHPPERRSGRRQGAAHRPGRRRRLRPRSPANSPTPDWSTARRWRPANCSRSPWKPTSCPPCSTPKANPCGWATSARTATRRPTRRPGDPRPGLCHLRRRQQLLPSPPRHPLGRWRPHRHRQPLPALQRLPPQADPRTRRRPHPLQPDGTYKLEHPPNLTSLAGPASHNTKPRNRRTRTPRAEPPRPTRARPIPANAAHQAAETGALLTGLKPNLASQDGHGAVAGPATRRSPRAVARAGATTACQTAETAPPASDDTNRTANHPLQC